AVVGMNGYLAKTGRGYRYQWTTNAMIQVGGLGQTNTGPSQYYEIDFGSDPNAAALKDQFESNAIANPTLYKWDSTAVNIYFIRVNGGHSSFPPKRIILLGGTVLGDGDTTSRTIVHETGHHFNLMHTHQGEEYQNLNGSDCNPQNCSCAQLI